LNLTEQKGIRSQAHSVVSPLNLHNSVYNFVVSPRICRKEKIWPSKHLHRKILSAGFDFGRAKNMAGLKYGRANTLAGLRDPIKMTKTLAGLRDPI